LQLTFVLGTVASPQPVNTLEPAESAHSYASHELVRSPTRELLFVFFFQKENYIYSIIFFSLFYLFIFVKIMEVVQVVLATVIVNHHFNIIFF